MELTKNGNKQMKLRKQTATSHKKIFFHLTGVINVSYNASFIIMTKVLILTW